ncbi:MAG: Uma2 family endonuclease [Gemmatimonadetes bacterium]|nr:Uma2 family endonuclease [Gemmatimonadota bacterium]
MPASSPIVPDISRRDWTVEERNALPDDGNRYEVVDGELLVTPAPTWRHQNAALELAVTLKAYAERRGLQCMIAPADVTFSPRRVVEPDVFVVPTVKVAPLALRRRRTARAGGGDPLPLIRPRRPSRQAAIVPV